MSNLNMHDVRDYYSALAWLAGRDSATLCYQTRVTKIGTVIEVTHHSTAILRYHADGVIEMQTEGWSTLTTTNRLHHMTPPEVRVSGAKGGSVTSPEYSGELPYEWTVVLGREGDR